MSDTIKLGISACLLGEEVRYNGEHKLDRYLRDTLGKLVEYVPVCPEVGCGMAIPREPLQLEGDIKHPRLMTIDTHKDYTKQMHSWGEIRLAELEKENLCGYIFKSGSPSCGIVEIEVFNEHCVMAGKGIGIWARMIMDHFPLLPVEEDSFLHDSGLRNNFMERVFALKSLRKTESGET